MLNMMHKEATKFQKRPVEDHIHNTKILGFTLIELMIAMTLGILLGAGLLQLFNTTKQSSLLGTHMGIIQDNADAAMRHIRKIAGFAFHQGLNIQEQVGCYKNSGSEPIMEEIANNIHYKACMNIASSPELNVNKKLYHTFGLKIGPDTGPCYAGYTGNPFMGRAFPCNSSNNPINIFAILGRGLSNRFVPFYFSGIYGGPEGNDTLIISYEGELEENTSTIVDCLGNPVPKSMLVINYFYIVQDNNNNPYLACDAKRFDLNTNVVTSTPTKKIASGVEGFRVAFALDTDSVGVVSKYVNADYFLTGPGSTDGDYHFGQANNDSAKVLGIQVAMLVRSDKSQVKLPTVGGTFDLLGNNHGPFTDRKMRKAFSNTFISNECVPTERRGCPGVIIRRSNYHASNIGGLIGGYLKADQTVWYELDNPPGSTIPLCGCQMDMNGNLFALEKKTTGEITTGNAVPFYTKLEGGNGESTAGGCTCSFRTGI